MSSPLQRLWVFSDLHLTDTTDALYSSFLKVLSTPNQAGDHVVLAGDIFDLLVGNSSYFAVKYSGFFDALKELRDRGVQIHYIEGNHDFHLSEILNPYGVTIEAEKVVLSAQTENGPRQILIEHGDLVDQEDRGYLALRKLFRSKPVEWLAHHVPGKVIERIGTRLSRPLRQKTSDLPHHWSPERLLSLRSVYRAHAEKKHRQGFDYIVLGHCHDLDQIEPFYWNMGYPPEHRQYLYWSRSDDVMKRLVFP